MRFSGLMKAIEGRVGVGEVRVGGDPEVLRVCEDSRKVRVGDLFVARGGTKTSGAGFVADAIARGAVGVVLERGQGSGVRGQITGDLAIVEVGDVNLALALLAHEVGGRPTAGMKVIGVTGTKGKTTVAYLMRSVLRAAGKRVGMVGTVEIDDGKEVVPAEMTTPGVVELVELFGRMKANGVEYVVMEVSSHSLDQQRVGGIEFAVGIFTNLTGDHLDYHGTMEAYAGAKARLFEGLKEGAVAVVNGDDAWVERMVGGCRGRVERYSVLAGGKPTTENTEGTEATTAWVAGIEEMTSGRMRLRVVGNWIGGGRREEAVIETPLVGRHNVYNILGVVAGARAVGVDRETIVGAIVGNGGAPGRLQRVEWGGAFQVFVDYAHTHDALENVLRALRATMGGGNIGGTPMPRLICVFGCGGDRDRTKRPKMGAVAERLADQVIVTSDNPRTEEPRGIIDEICSGFSAGWMETGNIAIMPDRRHAIRAAIELAAAGDVVLIAGKGHENYQIVGTTKHHFDDVEEAEGALRERFGAGGRKSEGGRMGNDQ